MSILSLRSGYGGLELAIQATFGIYRAWKQHTERNMS